MAPLRGQSDAAPDPRSDAGAGPGAPPAAVTALEDASSPQCERDKGPAELWRIERSISEVRTEMAELSSLEDAALCAHVAQLERRWRTELCALLSDTILGELHEFFDWMDDAPADPMMLRVGLAQLSGWLDGLVSGLDLAIREPNE